MGKNEVLYSHGGQPVFFQAEEGAPVSPSDTQTFKLGTLYIGNGGTVVIQTRQGSVLTFVNVPDGTFLPIIATKVLSTGTTAFNILVLR